MKKAFKKQKQIVQQESIQEITIIDIFEIISNPETETTIISKFEELIPDNSSILISLLRFYLKLIGLEFCTKWLKKTSLESINIKELIKKQEQLQEENQQVFIDEQQCSQIEKNQQLKLFFEGLFSTQTNLPFDCEDFFLYNFNWLTALTQVQYRNCRLAAVEIVRVFVNALLQYLEISKSMDQQKPIIKFLNNMYQYLATNRVQDVQPQIKKKVISIIFTGFQCDLLPRESFNNYIGQILTSDSHESRELALIELEFITKELVESKKSLSHMSEFLKQQQISLISLIFDQNESTQIRLIQFLRFLAKIGVIQYGFFNETASEAFFKILFTNNPRVRYECTFVLFIFSTQIQQLEDLIKFFFMHAPFQANGFKDCFNFITPFADSHTFVTEPESYALLFENYDKVEYQNLGLYFYASILNLQKKKQKFWWLNEGILENNLQDNFTHYFSGVQNIRLDLFDENLLLPYLYIYANLNLTILKQNQLNATLESIGKIIKKSTKTEIQNLSFKILKRFQEQLPDSLIIKQHIIEIVKYLQNIYQKQEIKNNVVQKLTFAFKHNILIGWKQILLPFDKVIDYQDENSCLNITYLLSQCLNNSLRILVLNIKLQDQELEDSYKEMRDHFYNYCIVTLENSNKSEYHFQILQELLRNLVYTNNHALKKLGLEFQLNTQQLELIFNNLNQYLFKDLINPQKRDSKQITKRKTITRLESIPNMSLEQMEIFNKSVKLICQCPSIMITPQLGMQIIRSLIYLVHNHEYFRNLQQPIVSAINQSLQKLIQQDSETKRNGFWVFIKKYAELFYSSDTDDVFGEFIQICLSTYYNQVTKANLIDKKNDFMSNCAEMIVFGFKEIKYLYLFGLLNHIFQRPQKLLKVLEIDKQAYQKFYAFYESKCNEFYKSDKPEQEKKEVEKTEKILKSRLKQMSGLTFKVIGKIKEQILSASKQGSCLKEKRQSINEDAIKMNKLEDEEEEEIPFSKSMKK